MAAKVEFLMQIESEKWISTLFIQQASTARHPVSFENFLKVYAVAPFNTTQSNF